MPTPVKALFTDIGGVLLTNGWDRTSRRKAAETFHLDYEEMDQRHHLTFDTYEEGKLSLETYLERVVFYQERSFSEEDFKKFMFAQSQRLPEMLGLLRDLKERHALKVTAVSNEGRELTEYRVKTFGLGDVIDTFVSSCFVHVRKPDVDIFRMALDMTQVAPEEALYLDDRAMFVEVAASLGIRGVIHKNPAETTKELGKLGLA